MHLTLAAANLFGIGHKAVTQVTGLLGGALVAFGVYRMIGHMAANRGAAIVGTGLMMFVIGMFVFAPSAMQGAMTSTAHLLTGTK